MIPNTALLTETANPPTAARFPSCMHFWKCDEASGATALVDAMGRANLTGIAAMTNGEGWVFPSVTAGTGTFSAELEDIGTSPCMLVQVADYGGAAGGLVLGASGSGDSLSLFRAGTAALIGGFAGTPDALTTPFPTLASGTIEGRALVVKSFSGNMQNLDYDYALDSYVAGTETATTNTASLVTDYLVWGCPSGVLKMYGAALFKFATVPSDAELRAILEWCTYAWANNYKTLPPWLEGRA